jgi:ketopantoate reductase
MSTADMRRVAIVGAGSIGVVFAVVFARSVDTGAGRDGDRGKARGSTA